MAAALSRVRFGLRVGTDYVNFTPAVRDFDTDIGCISDWTGILQDAPVSGDIIEQDWVDGALWQRGVNKTYSFEVPFTALVTNAINPNIWDSWNTGMRTLRTYRGPQLVIRRSFYDDTGALVAREQGAAVMVSGNTISEIGVGRVIKGLAVFQNLTGGWPIASLPGPV